MKLNELEDEKYWRIRDTLIENARRVSDIQITTGKIAQTYLLFTNAGAAIALIGFMGSSPELLKQSASWISLSLYCIGIVFCGILAIVSFLLVRGIGLRLNADMRELFDNRIEVAEFDGRRWAESRRPWTLAVALIPFFTFIAGTTVGICGLLVPFAK